MNRIVFVQIYSCAEGRLIKEYRYGLEGGQLVNAVYRIVREEEGEKECMNVRVVTYGLSKVDIRFCPYKKSDSPREVDK